MSVFANRVNIIDISLGGAKFTYSEPLVLKSDEIVLIGLEIGGKVYTLEARILRTWQGDSRRRQTRSLVRFGGIRQHKQDDGAGPVTQNPRHRAGSTTEGSIRGAAFPGKTRGAVVPFIPSQAPSPPGRPQELLVFLAIPTRAKEGAVPAPFNPAGLDQVSFAWSAGNTVLCHLADARRNPRFAAVPVVTVNTVPHLFPGNCPPRAPAPARRVIERHEAVGNAKSIRRGRVGLQYHTRKGKGTGRLAADAFIS